jgi:hypothetical protein
MDPHNTDVERAVVNDGKIYQSVNTDDHEEEALLDEKEDGTELEGAVSHRRAAPNFKSPRSWVYLIMAFAAGAISCITVQYVAPSFCGDRGSVAERRPQHFVDDPLTYGPMDDAGSTVVHNWPPISPTNAIPKYFPSNLGYAGPTPTGAEPALIVTGPSYPVHTGAPVLVPPTSNGGANGGRPTKKFDIFKKWGNLSPWYTVPSSSFGLDTSPNPPQGCNVTGLHLVHRHGARYPTSWSPYGGPANFAGRLHGASQKGIKWKASGDLTFLNDWTFKLGGELLTPFGRQQLYDLGISMRLKYGFLLEDFTNRLPVFRTETQDRMLYSALNFALGFFGYPLEGKYLQSITIEAPHFNNTLSPYHTCDNAGKSGISDLYMPSLKKWNGIYLADALRRFQPQMEGYKLTIEDVYTWQMLCAYETVAIGYSKFCELFTEKEWDGFEHAMDIYFWYGSGFGSPVGRAQGIGYIQELVARLTHTPIKLHNSSTNSTLDNNPITFPLNDTLYVDATHEVVVINIITALNLSNFATYPPPDDHIPDKRSFIMSELGPFAANIQFQLLSCDSAPEPQIRVIINDGVSPLTGIQGCPKQKDGMCPLSTFVKSQEKIIQETDWDWSCNGDWTKRPPSEWQTTTGDAPKRS